MLQSTDISLAWWTAHKQQTKRSHCGTLYCVGRTTQTLWHQRSHWSHWTHLVSRPLGLLQKLSLSLVSYSRLLNISQALLYWLTHRGLTTAMLTSLASAAMSASTPQLRPSHCWQTADNLRAKASAVTCNIVVLLVYNRTSYSPNCQR